MEKIISIDDESSDSEESLDEELIVSQGIELDNELKTFNMVEIEDKIKSIFKNTSLEIFLAKLKDKKNIPSEFVATSRADDKFFKNKTEYINNNYFEENFTFQAEFYENYSNHPAKKQKAQSVTKPHLFNLPSKNNHFTGREELLERIAISLKKSAKQETALQPITITACHGLGGIGKTQLAIEYVYRHLQEYTGIYWIDAETYEQVELAFNRFAQELNLSEKNFQQNIFETIKRWWHANPGYLIVFDNAEEYEQIEKYLPQLNGHVIITSRHIQWPSESIAVDLFSHEESIAYIKTILGKEIAKKNKDCENLAKVMGYLPLALAQACAYVKENPIDLKKYLKLYEKERKAILSSQLMPKGVKHLSVYFNWDITMNVLKKKLQSDMGEELLLLCAYLNHTNIPKELLTMYLNQKKIKDEHKQLEILRLLTNYSLLNFDNKVKCYAIHPVMQEVLILKLSARLQIEYLKKISDLLFIFYPYTKDQLKDINLKIKLISHIKTVIRKIEQVHLNSFWKNKEIEEAIVNLSTLLADAYFATGNYLKQKECLEKTLLIQENLYGKDSYHVEVTLTNLGNAYGGLGNFKKQKQLLKQALHIHNKNLDIDFIPTNEKNLGLVSILLNLSRIYEKFHNKTEALNLLLKAYDIQYKNNMINTPTWAMTVMNLGGAYSSLGYLEKGIKLLEQALELHNKIYDDKHPKTADNLRELGTAYLQLGNILNGKELLERALSIQEELYGKNHPIVLAALINLGTIHIKGNDFQQAEEYLKGALQILEENSSIEDNPDGTIILMKLAYLCHKQENIEQAINLANRAYHISVNCYGTQHLYTEQIRNKLNNYQSEINLASKLLL